MMMQQLFQQNRMMQQLLQNQQQPPPSHNASTNGFTGADGGARDAMLSRYAASEAVRIVTLLRSGVMAPFSAGRACAFEMSSVTRAMSATLLTTHPRGQAALKSLMTMTDMRVENFVPFTAVTFGMTEEDILETPKERLEVLIDCIMVMVKFGLSRGSDARNRVWDTALQLERDLHNVLAAVRLAYKSFKAVMLSDNMTHALSAAINADMADYLQQLAEAAATTVHLSPTSIDISVTHDIANWVFPRPHFAQTLDMCRNARTWQFNCQIMQAKISPSSRKRDITSASPPRGKRARQDDLNPCFQWQKTGQCNKEDCPFSHTTGTDKDACA
jgi:hypothetical protein